jgi:dipeptidyl aminopeptidase/acylaminoacyl peptidase
MYRAFVVAVTVVASLLAVNRTAYAAPPMSAVLHAAQSLTQYDDVAISPDGERVAFAQNQNHRTTLWIERIATRRLVRLTAGDGKRDAGESEPVWSPDGTRIAFFSDARSKEHDALFVADADGTHVRRLNALGGEAQRLAWSPDGTRLAFLYIAHPHRRAGALAAGAREVGVIGSVIDEQQLATVDARSGALTLITPANDYVYEYAWSPRSTRFALTYAPGNGDDNWWIAKLATVGARGGAMRDVLAPSFQINAPTWSPDGRSIAIIGGLMSDFGSVGGDVYVVPASGGAPRDLTQGAHFNAAALHWSSPTTIVMVAHVSGTLHLLALDVTTGATRTLLGGEETIRGVSFATRSPNIALVRTSFAMPPEVWAGTPSALHALTNANAGAPQLYGVARSLTWKNEGFTVQGWLIAPKRVDAAHTYPMVTIVHGGPSAESLPVFGSPFLAALSSRGFYVFEPNPRGSFGQGEAFTRANVKDFGYGDWRDDLAGVDAAIKAAPINPHRLGLFGWSYGGYMAMWAETQTRRFKAIVAGAGVVDWQSYYGQNNIDKWMIPFFGASVYDDPAVYAKSSPITFIKNSHTPVLILQGERDEEVPAAQAFEFYNAMQALHVPSQLVVYADEGHAPRKPKDQIDIFTRMTGWFEKYLR